MVAYLADSEFYNIDTVAREKAWHLLAILLRLGCPARPAELAARCTLFHVSADFVQFLCSIPASPLFLRDDLFVTISLAVLSSFGEFLSKMIVPFVPRIIVYSGPKRLWDDDVRTYFRKRKRFNSGSIVLPTAKRRLLFRAENGKNCLRLLSLANKMWSTSRKVNVDVPDDMNKDLESLSVVEYASDTLKRDTSVPYMFLDSNAGSSINKLKNIDHTDDTKETEVKYGDRDSMMILHRDLPQPLSLTNYQHSLFSIGFDLKIPKVLTEQGAEVREPDAGVACTKNTVEGPLMQHNDQIREDFTRITAHLNDEKQLSLAARIWLKEDNECGGSPTKVGLHDSHGCNAASDSMMGDAGTTGEIHFHKEKNVPGTKITRGYAENLQYYEMGGPSRNDEALAIRAHDVSTLTAGRKAENMEFSGFASSIQPSNATLVAGKSFDKLKPSHKDVLPLEVRVMNENRLINSQEQQEQFKADEKSISLKQKSKRSCNHNMPTNRNRAEPTSKAPKNHLEPKTLPDFESFIIEDEEGSGGYGTVYRARRKQDGKVFAVKCPHANAHLHHVNNELKMLERFGGRNFVIKYEGSFKSDGSDCFILEHVEHDRPEVLKREIDISELQWYGYCMFRALASLHKQGIVHRDVKPGNFLFSRKFSKGYLIDFNLATDLHQKYGTSSKVKTNSNGRLEHVPHPNVKDYSRSKEARKTVHLGFLEVASKGATNDSKTPLEMKNMKKRLDARHLRALMDVGNRKLYGSQGTDVSAVNSTKDATSTRTPSAERLREPMPCQGRKELISWAQQAIQSPNHEATSIPSSQRKRVAAPPGKADRSLVYLSPMPLHSNGIIVAGAGLLKNKGDGKYKKREGPCVGTKGFRAPEVLFKSPHQSVKVDMWSAGVTLLYMIIGRSPFIGDPEQNIKDIAKLRGSEDLWEVAKLHNRECSFPTDLFEIKALPSKDLREWCHLNTRRPGFHEMVPDLLFDLVDKCLTVNPRMRISAEEALRHKFFDPCRAALKKQRLLRQGPVVEFASQSL